MRSRRHPGRGRDLMQTAAAVVGSAAAAAVVRSRCHDPACPDFGDPDFGEATCPQEHAFPRLCDDEYRPNHPAGSCPEDCATCGEWRERRFRHDQ
jgi:hypothetical protein